MRAILNPCATGWPLSGATTNQPTRVGAIAPNSKPASHTGQLRGMRSATSAHTMPHTPPQKARLRTAGTPKGGIGRSEYGPLGMAPRAFKTPIAIWWKVKVASAPARKPRAAVFRGDRRERNGAMNGFVLEDRLADQERDDEEHHENRKEDAEQDLRDARRARRDAGEAERAGDQRDHQEDQGPFQHRALPRGRRPRLPRQARAAGAGSQADYATTVMRSAARVSPV